ncbi:MAG: RluA family pseudouridine synthase [Actinobacteria bacterium]|nr:RluA family pseudouridine synthase [Actinomycetota bacterium]
MNETIPAGLAGERVDRVVAMLTDLPRGEVARLVAEGLVTLDGRPVTAKGRRVAEGEQLAVELPAAADLRLTPDPEVEVHVVHADDEVIVVDKQAGLVVHPGSGHKTGTLVQGLLARFPDLGSIGVGEPDRPGVVHRLDAGTSGLLVVARTAAAYAELVEQLKARTVERRYLALVVGTVEAPAGLVDAPVGRSGADPTRMAVSSRGREARTRYETLERFTEPMECTLVECRLETGRTHQIRVHMRAIGHPVVGDPRYGGARAALGAPRPFLHAHQLSFVHPGTGQPASFSSPLPSDLAAVRRRLSP